jgi:hypothetical protein
MPMAIIFHFLYISIVTNIFYRHFEIESLSTTEKKTKIELEMTRQIKYTIKLYTTDVGINPTYGTCMHICTPHYSTQFIQNLITLLKKIMNRVELQLL